MSAETAAVMLDGLGGWYAVPGVGHEAAEAKLTLPPDLFPEQEPHCGAMHTPATYKCTRRAGHADPWHVASDGRHLLARWAR